MRQFRLELPQCLLRPARDLQSVRVQDVNSGKVRIEREGLGEFVARAREIGSLYFGGAQH